MLVKEWARLEGLHPQTVWKWCRQGTMPVPVEQTPTGMWLIHDPKYETMPQSKSMEPRTVCYARVSSGDQKNDLQRQADRLHSIHPEYKNVRYLGIFNPRLNTVYRYEVNRLPEETIEFVDYDIIVYPPEI